MDNLQIPPHSTWITCALTVNIGHGNMFVMRHYMFSDFALMRLDSGCGLCTDRHEPQHWI